MPEMTLIRRGRALLPANAEAEELLMKLPQGKALRSRISQPRNQHVHETFFGVIADVCQHWPHNHEFQPDGDPEYLRAWLLCKAGHREIFTFPAPSNEEGVKVMAQTMTAFVSAIKAKGEYPFIRTSSDAVAVFVAKTINHESMDEQAFRPIKTAVFEIIEAETCISVDDLIVEHKARSAA